MYSRVSDARQNIVKRSVESKSEVYKNPWDNLKQKLENIQYKFNTNTKV